MSLDKHQDRFNQKAKYEFMQEFSIIPNESEERHKPDTKKNSIKVSKNKQ
ncbi:MAG: hypothetical protein AAGU27_06410 [Dehalobacterium sp.]